MSLNSTQCHILAWTVLLIIGLPQCYGRPHPGSCAALGSPQDIQDQTLQELIAEAQARQAKNIPPLPSFAGSTSSIFDDSTISLPSHQVGFASRGGPRSLTLFPTGDPHFLGNSPDETLSSKTTVDKEDSSISRTGKALAPPVSGFRHLRKLSATRKGTRTSLPFRRRQKTTAPNERR